MKIKTIDINAKEWFDKINGNSYFSAKITLNYGMKSEKSFFLPFQYGYDDYYIQATFSFLTDKKLLKNDDLYINTLWRFCKDNKIILRTNKQKNCLKRELKN